jgi:hypothetical protein
LGTYWAPARWGIDGGVGRVNSGFGKTVSLVIWGNWARLCGWRSR